MTNVGKPCLLKNSSNITFTRNTNIVEKCSTVKLGNQTTYKTMKRKHRRGNRKRTKHINKSLRFLGVNAAGIFSKWTTFKKILYELEPAVFFIEETKCKVKGKLKLDNYCIYEQIRDIDPTKKGQVGGGLALGCKSVLQPMWVRDGGKDVEALSVNIFVVNMKIRCCVAYGCQETAPWERKQLFWNYLDEEVMLANQDGAGFVLQFDGNLWAGSGVIPGDPRPQNRNGKLFQLFLARNNLTVVNSLKLCKGIITRIRNLQNGKSELSTLDFFVVCSKILPHIKQMVIDEAKIYVLTNYSQVRKGGKSKDSDHLTEYMDLDFKIKPNKPKRVELFNFKNQNAQKYFKHITSETTQFTDCFEKDISLTEKLVKWKRVLNNHIKKAFPMIRLRNNKKIKTKASTFIDKKIQQAWKSK